jgi:FkbM family methyltransferase
MKSVQLLLIKIYELLKKSKILSFPLLHKLYIKTYFFYKKFFEAKNAIKMIQDISNLKKIEENQIIIDVGAHIGFFSLFFAKNFPGARIYSFEPEDSNRKTLMSIIKRKSSRNIQVFQNAIHNCDTEDSEFVLKIDKNHSGNHKVTTIDSSLIDYQRIRVSMLDTLFEAEKNKIYLIKIDTQGNELNVIKGALQIIKKSKPIIILEHEFKNTDYDMEYLIRFMKNIGYDHYEIATTFFSQDYIDIIFY